MALTRYKGKTGPALLSRKVFSFNPNSSVAYGSATSLSDYLGATGAGITRDPEWVWANNRSVRTVVRFIARNLAQVPVHIYSKSANGDRQRVRLSSSANLFGNPNFYQTQYSFMFELVVDYCKHERYLAAIVRTDDGITLQPIPPHLWKFRRNALRQPEHIYFPETGRLDRLDSGFYFWLDRYPDDLDGMTGLYDEIEEQRSAIHYRKNLWKKGPRIGGVIKRGLEAPDWDDDERTYMLEQWHKATEGGDAEGMTALLEDDMDFVPVEAVNPVDGQQLEWAKLSEAQVASAFGVSPVFVGLMDNANYSNVVAFREQLYGDTLGSWFQELEQAFNARLVHRFDPEGNYAEFHVDEKLRMSFKDRSSILLASVGGNAVMTVNEVRERLNLPRQEGFDEIIVPEYIDPDSDSGSDDDSGDEESDS